MHAGQETHTAEQSLDRLADGRGRHRAGFHKATEVLEIGPVGSESFRVAAGEKDVEEAGAIGESRRHGTRLGEGRHRAARVS